MPRRRRRGIRLFLAVAVAVVVVLAGYSAYAYVASAPGGSGPTLVVYTYASLFGGNCGSPIFASVFGAFASTHGVRVDVECPSGTLSSTLIAQRGAPRADLVIGLDEITAPQAHAAGVLVPYVSPQLAHVPANLSAELGPGHAVTPYEYGYLAIDYSQAMFLATRGAVAHSSLPDFATNASWARSLTVEDPTIDITGEEFLLWEIAYYQSVLHENWTAFWTSADPYLHTAPDWSSAFNAFNSSTSSESAVASYATDPAYAAYNGVSGTFNATVSNHQGTQYGWRTVYGIGIVNGSAHLGLDQQFVDWFLGGPVQSQIPTNEWEYPANDSIDLPSVFAAAIDPTPIVPLNPAISPEQIVNALPGWLDEWQRLENSLA